MLTNYPNGVSSFGAPLTGQSIPFAIGVGGVGKTYFVDATNGSDGNDGLSLETAVKTVSRANAIVTSNNHDNIVLSANAAHAITSMLTITKNRVHFIGLDSRSGYGMGARSRVTMGDSTVAADIALMQNTGVGNTFTGMKFDSSSTVAASLYGIAEGGEYSVYNRCEFYKSSDLDETTAAEILNNGDSTQWLNCTIGSSANIVADNKIRPNMSVTATLAGKKCRDNVIDNCVFLTKAGGTEHVDIYGTNATDVERLFLVKDTLFYNNLLAAADPAHAVGFGAAQTEGSVILKNCTSVSHTVMAQAAMNIFVDGAVPTFATTGISKAA